MKPLRPRIVVFLILVFALVGYDRAWAQAPLEPAQMPARTMFYAIWRGAPAGDIRKSNNLLALWDDPDLAPVRAAMFQNIQSSSEKDSTKQPITREEAEETSSSVDFAFDEKAVPSALRAGGRVSGSVLLQGTLARPRIEADLSAARLFLGDEGVGALEGRIMFDGTDLASLDAAITTDSGSRSAPRIDLRNFLLSFS